MPEALKVRAALAWHRAHAARLARELAELERGRGGAMGGYLISPGCECGPCPTACHHADCERTRSMAAAVCRLCGEGIGYERRYEDDGPPLGLVHGTCREDARGPA